MTLLARRPELNIDRLGAGVEQGLSLQITAELVALAKSPTHELEQAFSNLDEQRNQNSQWKGDPRRMLISNDSTYVVGMLIATLAFEDKKLPSTSMDWAKEKGQLTPISKANFDDITWGKELPASWPWEKKGPSWSVKPFRVRLWGSSHGALSPVIREFILSRPRRNL